MRWFAHLRFYACKLFVSAALIFVFVSGVPTSASGQSVVIADIQFAGRKINCGVPAISLLRVTGETKADGGRVQGASYLFVLVSAPVPKTIAPGRYWIVAVECPVQPRLELRAKHTGLFFRTDSIVGAIAVFDIAAGEVVNLGTIHVNMATRSVRMESLEPAVAELLKKEHPGLAVRMVHRRARIGGK